MRQMWNYERIYYINVDVYEGPERQSDIIEVNINSTCDTLAFKSIYLYI